IMDWHHPDWPIRRAWNDKATGTPDMDRFNTYLKGQVTEIVQNYHPGVMWFDGQWEKPWTNDRARDMYVYLRGLDPDLIINNRVSGGYGDFGTPEQTIPATGLGKGVDWESCMTLNNHWGYNSHDNHWKSVKTIIHNLVDCASKGGNYLLNVGPTAEGLIPAESVKRLAKVGDWMKQNGESIYGTSASPFKSLPWGRCTRKGAKLYLHVFERPADGVLIVPMTNRLTSASLLSEPTIALHFTRGADGVRITLPETLPSQDDTVIVAEVQGEIQPIAMSIHPAADGSFKLLAQDAELTGGVRVEGDPPNLGFWTNAKGTAAWPLSIDRPGKFEVTLTYALAPASTDNEYVLTLGDHSLTGTLSSTKSWHHYTKIKAGSITAAQGRTVLTIKPAKQPASGLMNLRLVTLTPVEN
ncbi:MAG: alpha-L-fucosidase, partial [Isosphaeraceae bacterium]